MKVLLVEDNKHFADFVTLSLKGSDIDVVSTLDDALDAVKAQYYGLILLDLGLPDSSGLDTLRAFGHISTPIVVITGSYDLNEEAALLGARDYIVKSNPEELVSRISFIINKLEAKRQKFAPAEFGEIKAYLTREKVLV